MKAILTIIVLGFGLPVRAVNDPCPSLLEMDKISGATSLDVVQGSRAYELSYLEGTRKFVLPSALAEIKRLSNKKVIVLAGNSGDPYQGTYHSLAFRLGDFMLGTLPRVTSGAGHFSERKELEITYDDGSKGIWKTEFLTEEPLYRTDSGEIFLFPNIRGFNIVVVKMIGDYNEVGDFAVPVVEALGLGPKDTVLVRDDLSSKYGTFNLEKGQAPKATGNNSIFSLTRNFSYRVIEDVIRFLKDSPELGAIPTEEFDSFRLPLRSLADIRLNSPQADPRYHQAFRNAESILNGIRGQLRTKVKDKYLKTYALDEAAEFNEQIRDLDLELREIFRANDQQASESRVAELKRRKANLTARVKEVKKKWESIYQKIDEEIQRIVNNGISYSQLTIGINPEIPFKPGQRADYVLSPYPTEVFNDHFWKQALEHLLTNL